MYITGLHLDLHVQTWARVFFYMFWSVFVCAIGNTPWANHEQTVNAVSDN